MDIMTILGLLLAFGGIVGGQLLEGGHPGSLIQGTAFLIVIVGSFGAAFVATTLQDAFDSTSIVSPIADPAVIKANTRNRCFAIAVPPRGFSQTRVQYYYMLLSPLLAESGPWWK